MSLTQEPRTVARRGAWWIQALGVYALSRIVLLPAMLLCWRQMQRDTDDFTISTLFSRGWDGHWYAQIAESGYPRSVPMGSDGTAEQSQLAFPPLYSALCRLVMEVTRLPWEVVAPLVAIAAGGAAALVVHRLVTEVAPDLVARKPWVPLATVGTLAFFPSAAIFSTAYSDSLALLLICAALLLLNRRQYGALAVVILMLGLTRPVAAPMFLVVLAHGLLRRRATARGDAPAIPRPEVVRWSGALAAAVAATLAWPLMAWARTGDARAYFTAQSAWRPERSAPVPFGEAWSFMQGSGAGIMFVAIVCFLAFGVLTQPFARRFGETIWLWSAFYFLFIIATVAPSFGLVRYLLLMPLVPLLLAAAPRTARGSAAVVAVMALLQSGWLLVSWRIGGQIP